MAEPDVLVVGGGIAGLTCAAFLARQGVHVTLLERDDRLGGLARSVKVDGWLIPANFARTDGLDPGDPKVRILEHLGVLERLHPAPLATACEVRIDDGFRLVVPAGLEAAREAFAAAFPADERGVRKTLAVFEKLATEVERLADDSRTAALRFLGFPFFYPALFRLRGRTCADVLRGRVRGRRARLALAALSPLVGTSTEAIGATAYALAATTMLRRPVALPGGGRSLVHALADAARSADVDVRLKRPALSVLTDGHRALGVRTEEGDLRAKIVVLNVPALAAFGSLVPREALYAGYLQRLGQMRVAASACILLLAVRIPRAELDAKADLVFVHAGDDLEAHARALDEDSVAGRTMALALHQAAADGGPSGDGTGCTLLTAAVPDRIARWAELDEARRAELSDETKSTLLARLSFLHAGLSGRIAASRLLTPLDLADWSGDPEGSLFGWEQTPSQSGSQRLEATTPVDRLLLAGSWTYPGAGYGATMLSGFLAGLGAAMALGKRVKM